MLTPLMESLIDSCLELVAKNQLPAIARKLRLTAEQAAGFLPDRQIFKPKARCILQQPG